MADQTENPRDVLAAERKVNAAGIRKTTSKFGARLEPLNGIVPEYATAAA